MDIKIHDIPASDLKKKDLEHLSFGKNFTDRMFLMEYDSKQDWHNARIEKYHYLSISPAANVFHYSQEIFEGVKVFNYKGGKVAIFRTEENFKRLNNSADRLCMPKIDIDFVLEATKKIVNLERGWVPTKKDTSLYIRPCMIGTEPVIKVKASESYLFFIILSPVGPYFGADVKMSRIMVEDEYVRAAVGGTGACKTGGNYASSIKAGMGAIEKGFDQVMWLDAKERKYIEEVGSMNIFFVIKDKIVTPELTGSILAGITRKSVLQLAKHLGYKTEERHISIDEVVEGLQSGEVTEVFGTGTACVVSPVGVVGYKGKEFKVGTEPGKYSKELYNHLTGIQYGEKEDIFNWMTIL